MPLAWGMDLATQVAELRAAGSTVETVFPDAGAGDVFGANALDPSTGFLPNSGTIRSFRCPKSRLDSCFIRRHAPDVLVRMSYFKLTHLQSRALIRRAAARLRQPSEEKVCT